MSAEKNIFFSIAFQTDKVNYKVASLLKSPTYNTKQKHTRCVNLMTHHDVIVTHRARTVYYTPGISRD